MLLLCANHSLSRFAAEIAERGHRAARPRADPAPPDAGVSKTFFVRPLEGVAQPYSNLSASHCRARPAVVSAAMWCRPASILSCCAVRSITAAIAASSNAGVELGESIAGAPGEGSATRHGRGPVVLAGGRSLLSQRRLRQGMDQRIPQDGKSSRLDRDPACDDSCNRFLGEQCLEEARSIRPCRRR
jgi:hypothetical protein